MREIQAAERCLCDKRLSNVNFFKDENSIKCWYQSHQQINSGEFYESFKMRCAVINILELLHILEKYFTDVCKRNILQISVSQNCFLSCFLLLSVEIV